MTEHLRPCCVVVLAVLSAGCYISDFPLSPAPEGALDTAILGTWHCVGSDPDDLDRPSAWRMTVTSPDTRRYRAEGSVPEETPAVWSLHASQIGDATILNVQELEEGEAKDGWVFVRYWRPRDHILDVHVLREEALEGKGASPEDLREAIGSALEDTSLYGHYCTCVRIAKEASSS